LKYVNSALRFYYLLNRTIDLQQCDEFHEQKSVRFFVKCHTESHSTLEDLWVYRNVGNTRLAIVHPV